ncbi:MAG: hypothetical protein DBX55_08725 [Verrucomicrobia bacterium]|nr:MAG: hypothetical protein DBX55_08725 [Verrucomicrobiota bacterium]
MSAFVNGGFCTEQLLHPTAFAQDNFYSSAFRTRFGFPRKFAIKPLKLIAGAGLRAIFPVSRTAAF